MNNSSPANSKSIAWTVGVFVAALVFVWVENQLRPDVAPDDQAQQATSTKLPDNSGKTPPPGPDLSEPPSGDDEVLTRQGEDFISRAGLVYGPGSRDGHRRNHVLQHTVDHPSKPIHGVFDDPKTVFALVDEAYQKVKSRSDDVITTRERGRTVHTVKMHRRIGYRGGERGDDEDHPPLTRIRLVLEGNRVITAFPY